MLKLTLPALFIGVVLAALPSGLQASSCGEEHEDWESLVAGSERIVEAEILDKRSRLTEDGIVETTYTLATITPIKGQNASIQEITLPGGEIAGQGTVIPGMPELSVGDRNILFLSKIEKSRNWRMPVGLKAGALKVEVDPHKPSKTKVLRQNLHGDRVSVESYTGTLNEIFTEVAHQG